MKNKIGVVTVTYNSVDVLAGFIKSLLLQKYTNYVLYVIDNDSQDHTLEVLNLYQTENLKLVVVRNSINLGVATANNQGIKKAMDDNCDQILLINNDIEFGCELFVDLIAGIQKYDADMVVPKMYYYDNPKKIWFAGGCFLKWKGYQNKHYGCGEIDNAQYDCDQVISYAPTCCMLIKKEVFLDIGYMDEKYFVYYDDTDFCLRAYKKKYKMYYLHYCSLLHKVSSLTGGDQSDFSLRYLMRNRIYYMKKNITQPLAWIWIFIIQFLLFVKLFIRKDTVNEYSIKQKALKEGLFL